MVKLGQYFSLAEDHPNKSALGELVVRHSRLRVKIQDIATLRMTLPNLSCDPPASGYRADDSRASSILFSCFAPIYLKAAPDAGRRFVVAELQSGLAATRLFEVTGTTSVDTAPGCFIIVLIQ